MKTRPAGPVLLALFCALSATRVVAVQPASVPAASTQPAPPRVSEPASIFLKFARAQVNEQVILAYIENAKRNFDLSADDIVYLKEQGVSDKVVAAALSHRVRLPVLSVSPAPGQEQAAPVQQQQPPAVVTQPQTTYVESAPQPVYVSSYPSYSYYNAYPYYGYYGYASYYPYYYPYRYGYGYGYRYPHYSHHYAHGHHGHGGYRGGNYGHGSHGSHGGHYNHNPAPAHNLNNASRAVWAATGGPAHNRSAVSGSSFRGGGAGAHNVSMPRSAPVSPTMSRGAGSGFSRGPSMASGGFRGGGGGGGGMRGGGGGGGRGR